MAATTSPALPAFSYAQAAKGLAPAASATQSQAQPSNRTPDLPTAEKKASTPLSEEPDSLHSAGPDEPTALKNAQASNDDALQPMLHNAEMSSKATSGSDQNISPVAKPLSASPNTDPKHSPEITSPILANSEATLPREDDMASNPNGALEAWDKQSEASTMVEKSHQQPLDPGLEKSGDEDWTNAPTAKTEKELRAAPMPTINIWEQRREAQEAKSKVGAVLRPSTPNTAPIRSKAATQQNRMLETSAPDEEGKRRPNGRAPEKGDGGLKKKQVGDSRPRDDGKKPPRPTRSGEPQRDTLAISTAASPMGDTASWPTPETANHEEKKRFHAQDKGEKTDLKSPGMKANQKWVPVPYVPTAKFSTPLPPTASRRGGKPTRGARDGGNRGGHFVQGTFPDRAEKPRSAGLSSSSRQTFDQQRGRDEETPDGSRAASGPSHAPRAASAGPTLADNRRSTPQALSERGGPESKNHTRGELQEVTFGGASSGHDGATSHQSRGASTSFSRQSSSSFRIGTHDPSRQTSVESHAHLRTYAGAERRNTNDENGRQGDIAARRDRSDSHRDNVKIRDFDSRSEFWRDRDRDLIGDRSEQRSGRSRGGYRGRGTHSHYAHALPMQPHAFTAPLPQQPFSASKSHHGSGPRHRQSSTPYNNMIASPHHRSTSRSISIPSHSNIYPGTPNSFVSPLSPTQADMNALHEGYHTVYPGVIGAVPYTPTIEPGALMSMVSAQLEYYFSIENLCKDMYLRSNMDSYGWVPLRVIAGFNRIKSLTEEMHLIQHVCQMSRNIELQHGEDGIDRVRKLEKWDQWILDVEQRQPHAQTDGPPPPPSGQSSSHSASIFPSTPQMASPNWTSGPFYASYTTEPPSFSASGLAIDNNNAIASPTCGHLPDIPSSEDFSLSNGRAMYGPGQPADVPARPSPVAQAQGIASSVLSPGSADMPVVNGDRPSSPPQIGVENAFSSERMNELHVCVRHPTHSSQPSFMSATSRTFSHGSIDGSIPSNERVMTPMPSLRGGASSPDRSYRPRDRSSCEKISDRSDRGVFWMKDGAPPDSWNQEGSTVEKYQSLRDRALAERIPGNVTDDMHWLYQFWSHFLVRNFNHDMYYDFLSLAWDDIDAGDAGGLDRLGQYYGALLTGQRILTERLAGDIVKLAESEMESRRPTFRNLRSAWRNGAFNLKSRKMIDRFLSLDLKAALEK